MFDRIGRIVPLPLRKKIEALLRFNNIEKKTDAYTGKIVIASIVFGIICLWLNFHLNITHPVIAFIVPALLAFVLILFMLNSKAEKAGGIVEKMLPDALQLIASNIKAGLTTEKALFDSALPEFASLSIELKNASKTILSGEKIDSALLNIPSKIKSSILDRSIWLIVQGIRNGGQISQLLTRLSDDLREENALKSEVNANISMYVMLIFFSAAFGAPALFGISSFIVGVLSEQSSGLGLTDADFVGYAAKSPALGLLSQSDTPKISEEFIVFFSEIALFFTCVFASLVLGVMSTGKERGGVRYIPILLIISFALFFATRIVISSMFGTMMF